MKKINLITKSILGLSLLMGATSCIDDRNFVDTDYKESDVPKEITEGFSLSFNVTLDNMGGYTSPNDPLVEIENYINPELFRVLFFDENDYFLFESKSRWVTQKEEIDGGNLWHVSVPVFSYGNDDPGYNWTRIRKSLTEGKFRIAILANRPEWVVYPDFVDVGGGGKEFYYSYPNWDSSDSYVKKIFDLHHCAYDDIYVQKNKSGEAGCYDILFGKDENADTDFGEKKENLMGAVYINIYKSTEQVDIMQGTKNTGKGALDISIAKMPTKDSPIPMYGVQLFDPLVDWVEGTTYNLSKLEGMYTNYETKNISMLRALVKTELLVPKSLPKPTLVALKYSNIYSRTEPLDVSTPTNELWETDHEKCEHTAIMNYGPITMDDNGQRGFWNYISWFYGIWKDMYKWNFNNKSFTMAPSTDDTPYPHIFNPMVQRNKIVYLANQYGVYVTSNSEVKDDPLNEANSQPSSIKWAKASENGISHEKWPYPAVGDFCMVDDPQYYRYVCYTGERAINDASNLGQTNNKEVNLLYWVVSFDNPYSHKDPGVPRYKNGQSIPQRDGHGDEEGWDQETGERIRGYEFDHYTIPFIDYSDKSNPFFNVTLNNYYTYEASDVFNNTRPIIKQCGLIKYKRTNDDCMQMNTLKNYMMDIRDTYNNGRSGYGGSWAPKYLPMPLIRNHVYRMIIRGVESENSNDQLDVITVDSEHLYSPTITFQ